MLVLARQVKERIVMPTIPATIEVVAVKSNSVRLGIDASPEVPIWREEVLRRGDVSPDNLLALSAADEKKDRARIQALLCKRFRDVALGLDLIRQQMNEIGTPELHTLIERMQAELSRIDREMRSLLSPATQQPSVIEPAISRMGRSLGLAEFRGGLAN